MKKNEIQIGGRYVAKVNGQLRVVRVDNIRVYNRSFGGYRSVGREQTIYEVTNTETGRTTTFKSASKFRSPTPLTGAKARLDKAIKELVTEQPPESRRLETAIHQLSDDAHRGVITKEQHDAAFDGLIKDEAQARGVQLPQKPLVEGYSPVGTCEGQTYEHVRVEPCKDTIAACNVCGRPNYARDQGLRPSGLALFDLILSSNGYQSQIVRVCPDCAKDLRSKLFPISA